MGHLLLSKPFIITKDTSYPATRPNGLQDISNKYHFIGECSFIAIKKSPLAGGYSKRMEMFEFIQLSVV